MVDIYEDICEISIQTECARSGYVVKITRVEDDSLSVFKRRFKEEVVHLEKSDLVRLVEQLHNIVQSKGTKNEFWNQMMGVN
jgi:hypothetical protein